MTTQDLQDKILDAIKAIGGTRGFVRTPADGSLVVDFEWRGTKYEHTLPRGTVATELGRERVCAQLLESLAALHDPAVPPSV